MKLWSALLILLGIVGVLILLCFLVIRHQKNHQNKVYDERQILLQGKSYAFGLIIGAAYYVILSFYLLLSSNQLTDGDMISLLVLAGIPAVFVAVELYCMMTGALLPLNDKMDQVFGCSCFMAGLAVFGIIVHICFHGMEMGDEPDKLWMDMIQFVWFASTAIIYRIAKWKDKRAEDEC